MTAPRSTLLDGRPDHRDGRDAGRRQVLLGAPTAFGDVLLMELDAAAIPVSDDSFTSEVARAAVRGRRGRGQPRRRRRARARRGVVERPARLRRRPGDDRPDPRTRSGAGDPCPIAFSPNLPDARSGQPRRRRGAAAGERHADRGRNAGRCRRRRTCRSSTSTWRPRRSPARPTLTGDRGALRAVDGDRRLRRRRRRRPLLVGAPPTHAYLYRGRSRPARRRSAIVTGAAPAGASARRWRRSTWTGTPATRR